VTASNPKPTRIASNSSQIERIRPTKFVSNTGKFWAKAKSGPPPKMSAVVAANKPLVMTFVERETDGEGRQKIATTANTNAPAPRKAQVSM
jgi:hypothetical protein